jgi:hypothetical protein
MYEHFKIFEFRRKFLKIFGASITIIGPPSHNIVGFIAMKAFRLRGDIRVYKDSSQQQELIRISGKQIVSFKPTYDVFDSSTN